MTPEQVTLVQQTFGQVAPIADKAAEIFYDRLFEVAPTVKPLFQGDMAEQRRKLIAMLAVVVRGLSDLPSILPAASALAKRHVDYGARPEHYPVVGAALLWTLERGLGPQWTSEAASAWTAAYSTLSSFMIGGLRLRAGSRIAFIRTHNSASSFRGAPPKWGLPDLGSIEGRSQVNPRSVARARNPSFRLVVMDSSPRRYRGSAGMTN